MSAPEADLQLQRLRESQEFVARVGGDLASFGVLPIDAPLPGQSSTADLRRRRRKRIEARVGVMSLVDDEGVLRWEFGSGPAPSARPGRRRRRRGQAPSGRVVERFKFEDLPPNQVAARLRQLDDHLTGAQDLFEVPRGVLDELAAARRSKDPKPVTLGPPARPPAQGRVLLLVHGTFSRCETLLGELAATDAGFDLLRSALAGQVYRKVLAFNHPTLSASPVLNAALLAQRFRGSAAEVDVICHSRGGLVTRWWLEVLDPQQRSDGRSRARVVFAGSPLAGTGLAAPYRLKGAIDVLTNLSRGLVLASNAAGYLVPVAAPIGHAAGVLFSMFGKLTALAASSPLLDAGVSMIPGLAAQSRVGTNGEIVRLRDGFRAFAEEERRVRFLDRYWFVRSNFETEDAGWRFWRNFRKGELADRVTDRVFEGDNDLVVDSGSMVDLADELALDGLGAPYVKEHVLDFGTSASVHHCNYFAQRRTVELVRSAFAL